LTKNSTKEKKPSVKIQKKEKGMVQQTINSPPSPERGPMGKFRGGMGGAPQQMGWAKKWAVEQ